jgi:hypothetical protein
MDYVKNYVNSRKYFNTKENILFGFLYDKGKKYPNGFIKFISPCKHSLCKKIGTFTEVLLLNERTVLRSLDKMRTSYKSKPLYLKALEELGDHGVFKGMPYLCYQDRETNLTTYKINFSIIKEILELKWIPPL